MSQTNISHPNKIYGFSNTPFAVVNSEQPCFHCGLKCINSLYKEADKLFCCSGCLTVFQFLNSQGMSDFYKIGVHPGNPIADSKRETYRFEFLDDKDLFNKITDFQLEEIAVITLKIPGIHCSSCIWLLENLHQMEKGIKKVQVNFLKKQARIHFEPSVIKLSVLANLLEKIGYPPELSWKNFKASKSQSHKQDIIKLGIAGFCFGNVMMLSFPDYISADVPPLYKSFFGYVCLFLALPVLLYAAKDWFLGAWKAITLRRMTLDIPIVTGLVILFIKSSYDILVNQEPGYLDSLCAFVFFMLLARFFQRVTFDKLSFTDGVLSYFPMAVTIKVNGTMHSVPFTKVNTGDELFLRHGEVIPVESILISENGLVDYSYLTGESELLAIQKNCKLHAGGKISGKGISVIATKPVEGQLLEQIWEDSNRDEIKNRKSFADQISPYFVVVISSIALVTFLVHLLLGHGFSVGLFCFASVLIITCPCALAISAPLVYGVMQRRLAKKGFYLRNGSIIEGLAEADTIVFDKTGTLTLPEKELIVVLDQLSADEKIAVGALASHSIHPVSKQLSKWDSISTSVSIFEEKTGSGIEGVCGSFKVKVGRGNWFTKEGFRLEEINFKSHPMEDLLFIAINDKIKGVYFLQDKFRKDWQLILTTFGKNYDLHLISGDQDKEKEKISQVIKNKQNIHFYFSPEDKMGYIQNLVKENKKVIMVGDGLNDQQALRSSHVGIAISEEAGHFSPASDVILLGEKWSELPYFIKVSRQAANLIKVNFGFSLLYNVFGIGIAVSGLLTPLFAAILMPISSLTVVLVALVGSAIVLKKG